MEPTFQPIDQLARPGRYEELVLDAPYQRGHVWGTERQRNFIKSLTMGLPTGAIFLNRRSIDEPDIVIDGKQRLTAANTWLRGDLPVPADWFEADRLADPDATTVTFCDLPVSLQHEDPYGLSQSW